MTFLHTIFLAALAASVIPVLLHLLNRQRLPLVKFSSLEFLQKLQKRKSRRVRIRQLILLILRALAVAAVVLVFARPALQSGEATGSAASVEMVIILDNGITSLSETKDGQSLKLSINVCRKLIELSEGTDRITLIPAAAPQKTITAPAGARDLIYERLQEMEYEYTAPDLELTRIITDSIFSSSDLFNREVYFVSGFYGSAWDSLDWQLSDDKVRRFVLPIGPERLDNLVASEVKLRSSILQRGEPLDLEASFVNHSDRDLRDALVSVYLDDERVVQASLDIPAGGVVSRSFAVIPEHSGLIAGRMKYEEIDPLMADSRRSFILHIPDSINVLCIAPEASDSLIISAALSSSGTGFVRLYRGDPVGWETTSLSGYDVLILAGIRSISTGASERVGEFVERGGGVVIFQGLDSDLAGLSRGLWRRLGFSGARGTIQEGSFGWGKFDLGHPLFSGIFEDKGMPRSPTFNFAVDMAIGRGDRVIIPLTNGRPFLLERQVGRGRALMFAVPLSPSVGDFAFTGIVAPLLFRAVGYTASSGSDGLYEWETGRSARMLLSLSRADAAQLEMPNDDIINLPPRPVVGGVEYELSKVSLPGVYNLKVKGQVVARYAANVPVTQSNLQRTTKKDLTERLGGAVLIRTDDEEIEEVIYTARFGRELWRPLALIFLLLLVSESLVGRAWKREGAD